MIFDNLLLRIRTAIYIGAVCSFPQHLRLPPQNRRSTRLKKALALLAPSSEASMPILPEGSSSPRSSAFPSSARGPLLRQYCALQTRHLSHTGYSELCSSRTFPWSRAIARPPAGPETICPSSWYFPFHSWCTSATRPMAARSAPIPLLRDIPRVLFRPDLTSLLCPQLPIAVLRPIFRRMMTRPGASSPFDPLLSAAAPRLR